MKKEHLIFHDLLAILFYFSQGDGKNCEMLNEMSHSSCEREEKEWSILKP